MPAKKTALLRGSVLSWMLLGLWLSYSTAILWTIKVNTAGAKSMCHYVPPK
jgi:hypothetical protein